LLTSLNALFLSKGHIEAAAPNGISLKALFLSFAECLREKNGLGVSFLALVGTSHIMSLGAAASMRPLDEVHASAVFYGTHESYPIPLYLNRVASLAPFFLACPYFSP
jgi:hypothetical protein